MAIVFNQEGLNAIQPPCVVQNFINHNAVLYKVFVVGESYTVVQRPSLKNFSAGTSGNPLSLVLSLCALGRAMMDTQCLSPGIPCYFWVREKWPKLKKLFTVDGLKRSRRTNERPCTKGTVGLQHSEPLPTLANF